MFDHSKTRSHAIGISFTDLSIWCFLCDEYITDPVLGKKTRAKETRTEEKKK